MLKDTNVGVIGNGTVGGATARSLLEYVKEVRVYDSNPLRRTHPLEKVLECDLTFVCLPTPQREGSLACDTSIVEGFFRTALDIDQYRENPTPTVARANRNFVLRSTVPVGFTRRMREEHGLVNLVHSPEFLTARCADQDAAMPNRLVIGHTSHTLEFSIAAQRLSTFYQQRWASVPVLTMTSDESEALKLFTNAHYATKVAQFNEFHAYATKKGLDWEAIHGAMLLDRHINPAHTQVPGPDGKYGFGGACLPKDASSLVHCLEQASLGAHVVTAALDRNKWIDRGGE